MKKSLATTLYGAVAAALIGFSTTAAADFSGAYDPTNWTLTNTSGGNGTVDTAGAPGSIKITGSDGVANQPLTLTSFTIAAPSAGTVYFDWLYVSRDNGDPGLGIPGGPEWDPAGYVVLNGTTIQLTADAGGNNQNGAWSFAVGAAEVFGFYVQSKENQFGSADLTISNFRVDTGTTPGVPEPGSVALLALGLLGMATSRKRRQS